MDTKILPPRERRSARERLLAAADELFYEGGIHTVGIDRIIERAGVAKASLYDAFGSKDELIRAYLLARQEARQARMVAKLKGHVTPRDQMLAVFDALGEAMEASNYRGCAFVRASAEEQPGSSVKSVVDASRAWTRGLFRDLAAGAGVAAPEALAQQLVLLYDGAAVSAQMDRNPGAAAAARAAAAALIDTAARPISD
jgi:AcrR family transcriptional regulator